MERQHSPEIEDWDNPSFIPLIKQPLRVEPKIRRFRRKAPRIPERDVPPIVPKFKIRGSIIFNRNLEDLVA